MRRGLFALMLVASLGHAHAAPNDLVARPLVLGQRQVEAQLVLEIDLAPFLVGKPLSIAPDVWVGVLPKLTVGLVHSGPSVDRFSPGATFCVTHNETSPRCVDTYHGSGIDARYLAYDDGHFSVAPRVRALVRQIDPVKPALTLGALARWTTGRFAITADPYLQLGLANTDEGNRHALFLPLTFAVQPTAHWELLLRTGFHSDLAVIEDGWHVPVAVGTRVVIERHFELGALLGFNSLLGPQNTAKERALFFMFGWRS